MLLWENSEDQTRVFKEWCALYNHLLTSGATIHIHFNFYHIPTSIPADRVYLYNDIHDLIKKSETLVIIGKIQSIFILKYLDLIQSYHGVIIDSGDNKYINHLVFHPTVYVSI